MSSGVFDSYRNGKLILFAGAGVSNCLGVPLWNSLMDFIGEELGYDPEIYKTFGDYYALAEYYRIQNGGVGPLRSWMDTNWHSQDVRLEDSSIHKLIVECDFPILYTTNYDRWLEKSYALYKRRYTKIVDVSDFSKIQDGVAQIVKFHGDFDNDDTIVLDESSYYDRLEFESPLDLKLRSDVLGNSILFVGYSLTDVNLRFLFYKLKKLWENSKKENVRPKSYILTHRPNPIQEAIFSQWGIEMIVSHESDPQKALEAFLIKLLESK